MQVPATDLIREGDALVAAEREKYENYLRERNAKQSEEIRFVVLENLINILTERVSALETKIRELRDA